MQEIKITEQNSKAYHSIFLDDDFEFQNPIEKWGELSITVLMSQIKNRLLLEKEAGILTADMAKMLNSEVAYERFAREIALKTWQEDLQEIKSQKVPEYLFKILENNTKKEQIKLLKNASLTRDELTAFFYQASEKYGYTLSRYKSEHHHNGLDVSKLPIAGYKDQSNQIVSLGKSELTLGEIKQAIDNRKVVVARFLDNGDKWHCFFFTFRSLKGEETGGKSHLHYISDTWGRTREVVLQQLKSSRYRLGPLPHIDYYL